MTNPDILDVIANTIAGFYVIEMSQTGSYGFERSLVGAASGFASSYFLNGNLSSTIIGGALNGEIGIITSAAAENQNYFDIALISSLSLTYLVNYTIPPSITSFTSLTAIISSTIYNNPDKINLLSKYLFDDEYFC
jgi:hypothetical protein